MIPFDSTLLQSPKKIEWDADDRQNLDAFLRTTTGARMLGLLAHRKPSFENGSDMGKTLVAAGKVEGYGKALDELLSLKTDRPPEAEETAKDPDTVTTEEYPDPDLPEGHPAWKNVDKTA